MKFVALPKTQEQDLRFWSPKKCKLHCDSPLALSWSCGAVVHSAWRDRLDLFALGLSTILRTQEPREGADYGADMRPWLVLE